MGKVPYNFYYHYLFTSSEEWLPDDLLELAGIAQHNGLQTRLLDWTYDYHVALYFSSIGLLDQVTSEEDSVVWALNYRYFDIMWNTVDRTPLSILRVPSSSWKTVP
ncbi:MAG: FRG domain-containing protein [Rectinemataceae bacterium]